MRAIGLAMLAAAATVALDGRANACALAWARAGPRRAAALPRN